jgi:hypothetical protein
MESFIETGRESRELKQNWQFVIIEVHRGNEFDVLVGLRMAIWRG